MSQPCPCTSGHPYRACCRPYHQGVLEPADCSTLVRARFSAFALKELAFLWDTLHLEHADRRRPKDEVLRELREACRRYRYTRLTLLEATPADAAGVARVRFEAQVFETEGNRSFSEASQFRHDGVGWRYLCGDLA